MKKFIKFLLAVGSLAGLAAGGYYIYKNYIAKKDADLADDFDDEDDFDDFDEDDSREYVSINITTEETPTEEAPAEEAQTEEAPVETVEENF